jgi:hypothetical protein
MNNHQARGTRRLVIALLLPWLIVWTAVYVFNMHNEVENQRIGNSYMNAAMRPNTSTVMSELNFNFAKENFAQRDIAESWEQKALLLGLGAPVVAASASMIGFWVWRGFRPKANSN